jgi:hypothetical protein
MGLSWQWPVSSSQLKFLTSTLFQYSVLFRI